MNEPLIQLQNIGKTYSSGKVSFEALKDIDLEIKRGEYVAILGPSGSGKSTMMQIIGCLSTPTVGSYILAGNEVSTLNAADLAKVRNQTIGFIFQKFNLLPQLTALDNVALPLVYRGVATHARNKLAQEILEKLGLGTHLKHRSNELSGGQQQRVAIARALITDPEVILADEPTGNLDTKSGGEVIDLFEQFFKQGKTIITVTHDLGFAEYARRIINIRDGRIVDEL